MTFKDSELPFVVFDEKETYVNKDLIYLELLEKYGVEKQLIQLIEECGELIQATTKKLNNKEHNMAEELADVGIMLEQITLFLDLGDEVYKIRNEKLLRMKKRLGA